MAATLNPDGTYTYPDGTKTPTGYKPDPDIPDGYIPRFDAKGNLSGYIDPNGVLVGQVKGAVQNPDGSITYPNGNGQYFTTKPGGTSSVNGGGLTTNFDTSGTPGGTTKADGSAASASDISNQSNAANGPLGKGGLFGLGGDGFSGVLDAAGGTVKRIFNPNAGDSPTYGPGGVGGGVSVGDAATNLKNFDPFKPATPRESPTVTAPTISAPTGPAAPPSIDFNTGLVTAGHIDQAPSAGTAPVVSAPVLGAGQQASAGSIGAGSIRGSTGMIAVSRADDVKDIAAGGPGRDAQLTSLQQLQDIASGKTKTAADWLLQKGIDQNVGAAYGLAASLQGRNPGVALRTGAITAKDAIAKSAADVAAQKAQEQQQAARDAATLATSITGQDLEALKSNQTKDLQLSVTNLQAKIDVLKANQQTQLEEGKADLAAQTATSIANLQAQTNVAIANMNNSTARDIANQTAALDASKSNAANAVALKITDANNQMAVLKANLEAQTSANNTNAANMTAKQIAELDSQTKLLQQYQDQLFQTAKANAENQLSANTTNATLAQKTQADNDAQDARLKQLGLESLIAQLNASLAVAKTDQEKQAAKDAFNAALLQTAGTVIGGIYGGPSGAAAGGLAGKFAGSQLGTNDAPILD